MEDKEKHIHQIEGIQTVTLLSYSPAPILPFSFLRQQALLCPGLGQATSYIFYEPDVYDDLDQEDPDDDLDIWLAIKFN